MKLQVVTVLATVGMSRIFLWLLWSSAWMQPQIRDHWHHGYTGVIILGLAWLLRGSPKIQALVNGIGLGLVFDELVLIISMFIVPIGYWNIWSWGSAIVLALSYAWWQWPKK